MWMADIRVNKQNVYLGVFNSELEAQEARIRAEFDYGVDPASKLEKARLAFEELYIPEPNTGCYLWLEAIRKNDGYGAKRHKKVDLAHRVSYVLFIGPIPRGFRVLHTCDVRSCVNPGHLRLEKHSKLE